MDYDNQIEQQSGGGWNNSLDDDVALLIELLVVGFGFWTPRGI